MNALFLACLLVFAVLSGCTQVSEMGSFNGPSQECIALCGQQKAKIDYSKGPCLANPLAQYPNYVCDIAHFPRSPIDDNPQNQCSAFSQGTAKHFIEVSPECHIIGTY